MKSHLAMLDFLTPNDRSTLSRFTSYAHSQRFAAFVNDLLFQFLGRDATNEPIDPQALAAARELSANLVHSVIKSSFPVVTFPVLVVAMIFIKDIGSSKFPVATGSEPHLFVIALMIAYKYCDDAASGLPTKEWSRITGLAPALLASLEREFCAAIEYNFYVDPDLFREWVAYFENHAELWQE
ncbi:uncharacterized protein BJ171DRAFT_475476 [Polychytrium aggregatum]|uniref:uncharacterized protein n=1 Tax=Polychytrium aggregatum TaxID=110093 RepID=UPI0022FE6F1E|nr:uncharacterized protein BJ171DRAFT_475476 [Polychytrium aggregatum]KAI9203771.1 hypothetical protein BJ171DRAFT_475476 [Polychytrium aggregatum]